MRKNHSNQPSLHNAVGPQRNAERSGIRNPHHNPAQAAVKFPAQHSIFQLQPLQLLDKYPRVRNALLRNLLPTTYPRLQLGLEPHAPSASLPDPTTVGTRAAH
jgi:hypothetical protein